MKQILVTVSHVAPQVINHIVFPISLDACLVISYNVFYSFPTFTNFINLIVNVFMLIEKPQVKNGCYRTTELQKKITDWNTTGKNKEVHSSVLVIAEHIIKLQILDAYEI